MALFTMPSEDLINLKNMLITFSLLSCFLASSKENYWICIVATVTVGMTFLLTSQAEITTNEDQIRPPRRQNHYLIDTLYDVLHIFQPVFSVLVNHVPEMGEVFKRADAKLVEFGFEPLNIQGSGQRTITDKDVSEIRYQLLPEAGSSFVPCDPHIHNSELLIFSPSDFCISAHETVSCRSGIILIIPENHYGELHSRLPGTNVMKKRHEAGLKREELTFVIKNDNAHSVTIVKGESLGNVSVKKNKSFQLKSVL